MTDQSRKDARRGTAKVHKDGDTVRRSVTIRRPMAEVEHQWNSAAIPGTATFSQAPGDRGVELRVEVSRDKQSALAEIRGALRNDDPGDSLSTALREFKARLETGEAPTTIGQSSGREGGPG